ncbi:ribosome biogenesis protein BMS1/TSR1, partial [Baffinella frigidus]
KQENFKGFRAVGELSRTSWDPGEDLPQEYKRTFQYRDFRGLYRRTLKQLEAWEAKTLKGEAPAAQPGEHVSIRLKNVSPEVAERIEAMMQSGAPVVLSSLLRHENKRSVLNMVLDRHPALPEQQLLRTRDTFELHMAFRRFRACPIFSHAASKVGGGSSKQGKYLESNFLLPRIPTQATVYAPTVWPNTPILMFRSKDMRLAATGSTTMVDADRIILKRVTLTGSPFRIHRATVVVRWMFNHASDVLALAGSKLFTKLGLEGEITGPLGTHGLMKCVFSTMSQAISHKDTVLLHLYKRVFPSVPDEPVETETDESG